MLLASACAMEAGFIALAALGNFEQRVVEFTGLYLGTSIFYLIGCFVITRFDAKQSGPTPGRVHLDLRVGVSASRFFRFRPSFPKI